MTESATVELIVAEPIVTARLRLDPVTVGDADDMAVVYADPRMYEFTGGEPLTVETLRRRYEALSSGRSPDGMESWLNWIVRPVGQQVAVGAVQATVMHRSGEAWIAWEIGVTSQGLGYAGEAAHALVGWLAGRSVGLIGAYIHPDHLASQAVARRAGLRRTDATADGEEMWIAG
jgi:RimJ/RimL family protein N-acetyltransferase